MNRTLKAHYAGTCPSCGYDWWPGAFIVNGPDGWEHASCATSDRSESTEADPLEVTGPVCSSCWLTHAGECY